MYSLKNVFTQSPEKVKITVLAVLGVWAGVRGWDPSLLETVGVGIAIERTLDLFYVAPVRSAQLDAVTQAHQDAALNGIALGQQLAGAVAATPAPAVVDDPPAGAVVEAPVVVVPPAEPPPEGAV